MSPQALAQHLARERLSAAYRELGFPEDAIEYIELCQLGQFYEHFYEGHDIPEEERSEFKGKVFSGVLFSEANYQSDIRDMFEQSFPSIYEYLCFLKEGDYTNAAFVLQQAESDFMFNRVAAKLVAEHPDLPFVTIHDSFIATSRDTPSIERILMEEFEKIGLLPSFKTKELVRPTAMPLRAAA